MHKKTKARKVGDGWRVNADGSFAHKRTPLATIVVSGTVRTSKRKRRAVQNQLKERALEAFSHFPFPVVETPKPRGRSKRR